MKFSKLVVKGAVVMAMGIALLSGSSYGSETGAVVPPEKALEKLMNGNRRFVGDDDRKIEEHSDRRARELVAAGQSPYAIIVDCSDSRLSPEIVFDKGLGEVFVVRVAGNVVAAHELGSIEYGAEHLGSSLIMVLGHERCGAVTAAATPNASTEGNIGSLIADILPAVNEANVILQGTNATQAQLVETAIVENVKNVAEAIMTHSHIIKELVETGKVKIVGGKYDLDTGKVELIEIAE